MKKFRYTMQIHKDVVVFANDLDEAMDRAMAEDFEPQDFTVVEQIPTRCSEQYIDTLRIHEQN